MLVLIAIILFIILVLYQLRKNDIQEGYGYTVNDYSVQWNNRAGIENSVQKWIFVFVNKKGEKYHTKQFEKGIDPDTMFKNFVTVDNTKLIDNLTFDVDITGTNKLKVYYNTEDTNHFITEKEFEYSDFGISLSDIQQFKENPPSSESEPGTAYTYSPGFEWGYYNDNYNDDGYSGQQTWFDTRKPVHTHNTQGRSRVTDFSDINTASSGQTLVNGDETYSYLWTGYFKAPSTGTYYFNTRSDDNSHMWIGPAALNPRYDNVTVNNGGLHDMQTATSDGVSLIGGEYYDFRMTFGEQGNGDNLQAQWRLSTGLFTYDWSTVAFSNRQISGGSSSITIAFHYDTFSSSDYSSAYSTVSDAANAGHVYSNTPSGTYTWGTLGTPSTASNQTTYTWTPSGTITASVLMVAGGGAGGGWWHGGGGGAGGLVYYSNQSLSGSKTIKVGNGGYQNGGNQTSGAWSNGFNTEFTGLTTAVGGGKGGTDYSKPGPGSSGGSGGGATGFSNGSGGSGTSGQGNSGGNGRSGRLPNGYNVGGGGGGAGGVGANEDSGGHGGDGVDYSSVFGTTYGDSGWFAGGGAGGGYGGQDGGNGGNGGGGNGSSRTGNAQAGQAHTGGGGGGEGDLTRMSAKGGGSGIVLVKYKPE